MLLSQEKALKRPSVVNVCEGIDSRHTVLARIQQHILQRIIYFESLTNQSRTFLFLANLHLKLFSPVMKLAVIFLRHRRLLPRSKKHKLERDPNRRKPYTLS